jgi:hypothetical protein
MGSGGTVTDPTPPPPPPSVWQSNGSALHTLWVTNIQYTNTL